MTRMNSTPRINWPISTHCSLGTDDVQVWAANLQAIPAILAGYLELLSSGERARAGRFHFDRDRNRFIVGRGWLRTILGRYLRVSPRAVQIDYDLNGKPTLRSTALLPHSRAEPPLNAPGLTGPHSRFTGGEWTDASSLDKRPFQAQAGSMVQSLSSERAATASLPGRANVIQFNLAHSQDLALVAVTRLGPVGVDVEQLQPINDAAELGRQFFSERESTILDALPIAERPAAFFNLWTRKEALLKATGEGIGHLLHRVEVSCLNNEPARFLALPGSAGELDEWALHALAPAPGFVAALAVRARIARLECRQWEHVEAPDSGSESGATALAEFPATPLHHDPPR